MRLEDAEFCLPALRGSRSLKRLRLSPGFQEATDAQWTPRIGFRYALGAQSNVYGTYSKGFKSGVFDATTPTGSGVKPETVDAFELGFKSAWRGLSFNAAAFYYDYKNTQVNATVSGHNGAVFNQLFNVPQSRIYGAEFDANLEITDNFDLRAAVAYTHARYTEGVGLEFLL